jgi:hypothetical protein
VGKASVFKLIEILRQLVVEAYAAASAEVSPDCLAMVIPLFGRNEADVEQRGSQSLADQTRNRFWGNEINSDQLAPGHSFGGIDTGHGRRGRQVGGILLRRLLPWQRAVAAAV